MSDNREAFEKWLSDLLEFDHEDLRETRYTDEDGIHGYIGLEKKGYSENADGLAGLSFQAWQAARAAHKAAEKFRHQVLALQEEIRALEEENRALRNVKTAKVVR